MKRRYLWMITILLMFTAAAAETTPYDTARSVANFMEDHYGVQILIGSECKDISIPGLEIGDTPTGRTPLQALLAQKDYETERK